MKILLSLILLLTLSACTQVLEVEEFGLIHKIEIKKKDLLAVNKVLISQGSSQTVTRTESCETLGLCCKCGFTISMKWECSCGTWRNCPGNHTVTRRFTPYTYRNKYTVRAEKDVKTYESKIVADTENLVVSAGTCHQE